MSIWEKEMFRPYMKKLQNPVKGFVALIHVYGKT